MNTRHAAEDSAFRQERYMSSPENVRGLLANCVAARVQTLADPEHRKMIWFLQKLSWEAGGLEKLASGIIARWPERFVTASMERLGCGQGRIYDADEVKAVRGELPDRDAREFLLRGERNACGGLGDLIEDWTDRSEAEQRRAEEERQAQPQKYPAAQFATTCREAAEGHLAEFLFERFCLDPAVKLNPPPLWYFPRLVETLAELHEEHASAARARAPLTQIGAEVSETLDYALAERCLVVVDGLARTGKTFSVKQWCDAHPGQARYFQVPSSSDEISFYRALCQTLGLGAGRAYKVNDLRAKVESVLQTGDLLLVADEAHYLWPQRNVRQASIPQRINWVLTQLVNMGVPVAMVTTPQFTKNQEAIVRNGGWSSEQLIGRISLYKRLPESLGEDDLEAVARHWLPAGERQAIRLLVGYARGSEKYLQGIESLARRSHFLARKAGREQPTSADVGTALEEGVIPSDNALAAALDGALKRGSRKPVTVTFSAPLQTVCKSPSREIQPLEQTTFTPPVRETGDAVLST